MSIFCTVIRGPKIAQFPYNQQSLKIKIQRCLELLLCTVEEIWKEKDSFKIEISQEHLENSLKAGISEIYTR